MSTLLAAALASASASSSSDKRGGRLSVTMSRMKRQLGGGGEDSFVLEDVDEAEEEVEEGLRRQRDQLLMLQRLGGF